jgi:probable O-glycosylation ligase (exosortase A-associated)
MRDILITLIIFGSIPFILRKPYIGALMWVWISVMNPHTQGWGFAVEFPFAAIIAGVTIFSLFFNRIPKNIPLTPVVLTLIAFVFWLNVTTLYALHPELVYEQWNKVMKIMLMTFVVLMLIKTKQHIQLLIGIIVFSLAYYGVKGGIFTITTGGEFRVWGPGESFISGNNEMALALIMIIPLLHYFQVISKQMWIRHSLTAAMFLCGVAALGSYSRGALLAIIAMGAFLWFKSKHKIQLAILLILAIPLMLTFMPEQWSVRMDTISTYEDDGSVQGRFNAWGAAYNLAKDRPLLGGGFEVATREVFDRYAPDVADVPRAAHSIYFQALGEHGFVGLGLYLLLGFLTWRTGVWIIRNTRGLNEYQWAFGMASMIQVSLIGYAVGGAFLSLLYYDVPYYLMIAMVATRSIIEQELEEKAALAIPVKSTDSSLQLGKPKPLRPITRDSG